MAKKIGGRRESAQRCLERKWRCARVFASTACFAWGSLVAALLRTQGKTRQDKATQRCLRFACLLAALLALFPFPSLLPTRRRPPPPLSDRARSSSSPFLPLPSFLFVARRLSFDSEDTASKDESQGEVFFPLSGIPAPFSSPRLFKQARRTHRTLVRFQGSSVRLSSILIRTFYPTRLESASESLPALTFGCD